MKFADFQARSHFDKQELLGMAHGTLVTDAPDEWSLRLPAPPMLMIDRIVDITESRSRGTIVASS